jgi:hypothetical protein
MRRLPLPPAAQEVKTIGAQASVQAKPAAARRPPKARAPAAARTAMTKTTRSPVKPRLRVVPAAPVKARRKAAAA